MMENSVLPIVVCGLFIYLFCGALHLSYHKTLMCVFYYSWKHLSFKVVGIINEVERVFVLSSVLIGLIVLSIPLFPLRISLPIFFDVHI